MNKENERVSEWEDGLLTPEELVPLTQALITPELALALSITQELAPAPVEIQLTTQSSIVSLCRQGNFPYSSELHHSLHTNVNLSDSPSLRSERGARSCEPPVIFPECGNGSCQHAKTDLSNNGSYTPQHGSSPGFGDNSPMPNGMIFGALDKRLDNGYGGGISGMESNEYGGANVGKKPRKQLDTEFEDADSGGGLENSGEEPTARTLKRPRLVWTPQLHKRFVDAVAHLGIKNAVPKTIMQLMNVEGLTRENVASHLQKYRLYLKRMQGLSSEGPSVSDQLFASTPVPPSLAASAHFLPNHRDDIVPLIVPLQIAGLGHGHVVGPLGAAAPYASFDHHFYNLARPPAQRLPSGYQDFVIDNQGRSDSPQRRILTLFPTNGC